MDKTDKTFFEQKIKPILLYVGTIGACIMSLAYIVLMFVLVLGFKSTTTLSQSIVFAVINAVVGFIIMQFLKIQGIDFAKQLPKSKSVLEKFLLNVEEKKAKTHSLTYFWIKTVLVDILVKVLTIGIMTSAIIYIVIEGSNDYNMLLMSVVNLLMFICFGFISLVKSYDFFNTKYIPYLEDKINERTTKRKEEVVAMVETKPTHKEDDSLLSCRGTDILDTGMAAIPTLPTDEQSMVQHSECRSDSVLGRTIYASYRTTIGTDFPIEEDTQKDKKQGE